MKMLLSWLSGLIFGLGLLISGMTVPDKVIGFLDVTGDWDPALAGVMVGAIATFGLARLLWGDRRPVLDTRFHLPSFHDIDLRLVGGSALFGVGWGLSGFCPGPAVVAAGSGADSALWFGMFMLAGMGLARLLEAAARRLPSERRPLGSAHPAET